MKNSKKDLPEKGKIFMILKAPTDEQILCSDGSFMSHQDFQLLRDTGKLRELQKPSVSENGIYEEVEMSDAELKDWLDMRKRSVERARDNVIKHYRRCRDQGINPASVEIPELDALDYEVSRANHTVNTLLERLTSRRNKIQEKRPCDRPPGYSNLVTTLTGKICGLKADRDFINAKPRLSNVTENLPPAARKSRIGRRRTVNRHFRLQEATA